MKRYIEKIQNHMDGKLISRICFYICLYIPLILVATFVSGIAVTLFLLPFLMAIKWLYF